MSLPNKAIQEFKKLYKEKNGEDLSDDVAREAAERLIRVVGVVYKPIPKEYAEEYERIKRETEEVQAKMKELEKIDLVKRYVGEARLTLAQKIRKKNR